MSFFDTLRTKYFQWFKAFYLAGYHWSMKKRMKRLDKKHEEREYERR
jgi:hypothetical protein